MKEKAKCMRQTDTAQRVWFCQRDFGHAGPCSPFGGHELFDLARCGGRSDGGSCFRPMKHDGPCEYAPGGAP